MSTGSAGGSQARPRPVDELVSKWAAPRFRAAGFRRKHRVFCRGGRHGVQIRVEFRMHPLLPPQDTFWLEWRPSSPDRQDILASRVPIPPVMCLDATYLSRFPAEHAHLQSDLWRVGHDTVDVYGPLLGKLLDSTLLPVWERVANQAEARPEPEAQLARLKLPRSAFTAEVLTQVVGGQPAHVRAKIEQLAQEFPDNVWVEWWRSQLLASSTS